MKSWFTIDEESRSAWVRLGSRRPVKGHQDLIGRGRESSPVAEREGFEPSKGLPPYGISSAAPSAN